MGVLRSEFMSHGTLVLPHEWARDYVDLLGHKTQIMFEDMNSSVMQRPYRRYIQRIEEMERMVRFLSKEVENMPNVEVSKNRIDDFLDHDDEFTLDSLEAEVKRVYERFCRFHSNNEEMTDELEAAVEELNVVKDSISTGFLAAGEGLSQPLLEGEPTGQGSRRREDHMQFSNIAGVVKMEDQESFARTVFRATRGNTFTQFVEIPDTRKSVFVIYFQSTTAASAMSAKVHRICSAVGVHIYQWPSCKDEAMQRIADLETVIADKRRALAGFSKYTLDEARSLLEPIRMGGNSRIEEWRLFCIEERSIYATLNLFEGSVSMRCDCWYPTKDKDSIREVLASSGLAASAMLIDDEHDPKTAAPTYTRKNEFTAAFQSLIDTYGTPRYQEFNAGVVSIITFPFMFGLMYGDVGHGTLLTCFALWAVKNAKKWKYSDDEMVQGLVYSRYLILFMGLFAIYAGCLYNDLLGVGIHWFGTSRYEDPAEYGHASLFEMKPKAWFDTLNTGEGSGPYPFGIDPAWHNSTNELLFMNSLKMKLSVLFGVIQMIFGVCIKFSNDTYYRDALDWITVCIPQMAFMICFFGYMDWMIMYKWVTPVTQDPTLNGAPSLINTLISFGLGQADKQPLYAGQFTIQKWFMIIILLSLPLMLLPKPIIISIERSYKAKKAARQAAIAQQDVEAQSLLPKDDKEAEEPTEPGMDEVWIYQMIETIEYVLGCVSHTASYLRIWALSLAHQQLSVVFFQMIMQGSLESTGALSPIFIYCAFAVLFGITLGVLMFMDVLECTLHTLRLHWVEFMSKFYMGDGYPFVPYRHFDIIKDELQG
ncbi:vacuolar proton translocating ATPase 116 kDa subunit A isoform, putative [Perkinsus marinus ATCC 50983]|uniref:V-type proton ATPase subunit a n=2 Tax=Perkinsus marinus (strain ATCC 50983 / TXsc) TaxID=423536 RepID=C5LX80_PERM5|nr:vacuolar proton translocating ATPase 116 kDa subunit A isoform, putative [Perkinsus marinus ATCC 50983]EEQ98629.1 vacuolar proton translocating ATPase 116 kDa subunit A isoform, putative [Perkinsus marinus ATCC 50983]|eukprot:XP_002765912.1 vacuolar proton translocating ATPase 116 kDa subunit A isoform, putative [Perkinsus marinus ATCC 50983]